MGFERWSDGRLDERIFIVPEQDLDCDERKAPECAPYSYDGVGVASFEEANCTTEVGAIGNETCRIGGPGCDERAGTSSSCAPTPYCVPGIYCALSQCDAALDMCLFGGPLDETLACTFPFVASGPEEDTSCPSFEVDLAPSLPVATTCMGPTSKLLFEAPEPAMPRAFRDAVDLVTMNNTTPYVFKIGMKHVRDCVYRMDLQGEKAALASGIGKRLFVQLWIVTATGVSQKILVPLSFQMPRVASPSACGTLAGCHLEYLPGEALERCMR